MTERREIDRHHKWRWGHDPQDDDADESSPWEYATLKPPSQSSVETEGALGTGVDTRVRCARCKGDTYRVVAEAKMGELLSKKANVEDATPEQLEEQIALLVCPKCDNRMSMTVEVLKVAMERRK